MPRPGLAKDQKTKIEKDEKDHRFFYHFIVLLYHFVAPCLAKNYSGLLLAASR
jgi:hypothetical protein